MRAYEAFLSKEAARFRSGVQKRTAAVPFIDMLGQLSPFSVSAPVIQKAKYNKRAQAKRVKVQGVINPQMPLLPPGVKTPMRALKHTEVEPLLGFGEPRPRLTATRPQAPSAAKAGKPWGKLALGAVGLGALAYAGYQASKPTEYGSAERKNEAS